MLILSVLKTMGFGYYFLESMIIHSSFALVDYYALSELPKPHVFNTDRINV